MKMTMNEQLCFVHFLMNRLKITIEFGLSEFLPQTVTFGLFIPPWLDGLLQCFLSSFPSICSDVFCSVYTHLCRFIRNTWAGMEWWQSVFWIRHHMDHLLTDCASLSLDKKVHKILCYHGIVLVFFFIHDNYKIILKLNLQNSLLLEFTTKCVLYYFYL